MTAYDVLIEAAREQRAELTAKLYGALGYWRIEWEREDFLIVDQQVDAVGEERVVREHRDLETACQSVLNAIGFED